jgi:tRNA-specific 2-thiouridylase
VNFLIFDELEKECEVEVKTRYSTRAYKAVIMPFENNVKVIFDKPQKAITAGQSAVFYIDDTVIGGGKIV